jgi:hypothetical protein
MIYYTMPWDSGVNVGRYYNSFMEALPNDEDAACFMDADAALVTGPYGRQFEAILRRYPECGLFFGMTNRLGCQHQVVKSVDPVSNDIAYHRKVGAELLEKYWDECVQVTATKTDLMSGVLFILRKAAWKKAGRFLDKGILGVDNDMHAKVAAAGIPVMLMKGAYVYHWYRGGKRNVTAHLKTTRKAVYTAITGGYDTLMDPAVITPGWDYVCFTDTPGIRSSVWNVIQFSPGDDPAKEARKRKILAHKFMGWYGTTVWVDGNMRILCDMDDLVARFHGQNAITMMRHPERDCIYDEAEACKALGKDDPGTIDAHIEKVREMGCPEKNGMVATGVIFRSGSDPDVKRLCNEWWKMVDSGSRRDQLSFNCAAWKERVRYREVDFDSVIGPMIEKVKHTRKARKVEATVRGPEPVIPIQKFDLSKGDPLVTVVIPTRNRPELLLHAIGMVRMQSWKKREIVILDDSDLEFRIPKIAAPDINYIAMDMRATLGEKHDMALRISTGDVVAHWDDDDWFSETRLESQVKAMRETGSDLCGIGLDLILMNGSLWRLNVERGETLGNCDVRPDFTFYDATAMFTRGAVPTSAMYGTRQVGQKAKFLNDLVASGIKWTSVENCGKFVYVRHGSNNWKFDEASAMIPAPKPLWFPGHEALFYSSIGGVHAGQADQVH